MAGKEIDRARATAALEVIRQHPGMVLFASIPALVAIGAVWWILGAGWAVLLAAVLVIAGGAAILLRRD